MKPTETEEFPETGARALDGKKVLFIGNSHTYYGRTVLYKSTSVLDQAPRSNDHGYFYQLCKENGADVKVTNWTFSAHNLSDQYAICSANRGCDGIRHFNDLTDKNFDYVIIQQGSGNLSAELNLKAVKTVMEIFREANPNVKFVYSVQHRAYMDHYKWLEGLDAIREMGVKVVEWGRIVTDVFTGALQVPGAKETYDKNTFIVCQSEKDGYHPNLLTGYLTTLSLYCAITGESAVGKGYSFCGDKSIESLFDFDAFIEKYYTYQSAKTNFPAVFASESDMRGLQELVDQMLSE